MQNISFVIYQLQSWCRKITSSSHGQKRKADFSLQFAHFNQRFWSHLYKIIIIDDILVHYTMLNRCSTIWRFFSVDTLLQVWLGLGIALAVLPPILAFLSACYRRYVKQNNNTVLNVSENRSAVSFASILHNSSFLLSQIINQGIYFAVLFDYVLWFSYFSLSNFLYEGYHYSLRLESRGSYIVVGAWCLVAVVLANAYAGTLFSYLSVSKLKPIVNSLEELAQSKDLQLIVQDKSELATRFLVKN